MGFKSLIVTALTAFAAVGCASRGDVVEENKATFRIDPETGCMYEVKEGDNPDTPRPCLHVPDFPRRDKN